MELKIILIILAWHFVADFIFQTRKMATRKSTSIRWLSEHVGIYSIISMFLFIVIDLRSLMEYNPINWFKHMGYFFVITFITHWLTDFCTSRITTYYYKKRNFYAFFNVIGLDQLIHTCTLLLTYYYIL